MSIAPPWDIDYLVVGAGAACCVLAGRLSADGKTRVLLLEAGDDCPPGEEHHSIRDVYPASLNYPQFNWADLTAETGADPGTGAARASRHFLQGRGVGGGSNIYGMLSFRGQPEDYDEWRDLGAVGWGWDDVVPYFRRLENDLDFQGPEHGHDGPIPIRRIRPKDWSPFSRAFGDAVLQRGYPWVEDFNVDRRPGVGPVPTASLPDRRISAARGYLSPAVRARANLKIIANAYVERIDIQDARAVGVTARTPGGRVSLKAKEVIVSAGAIFSPAILMRSGLGPGQHLQELGIAVVRDLRGVGRNLMNHAQVLLAMHLQRTAIAMRPEFAQAGLRYSSGMAGCTENDMLLVAINRSAWHPLGRRIGGLGLSIRKTYSKGEVRLKSPNPTVVPDVRFNLLSDPRDLGRLVDGVKFCCEILAASPLRGVANEVFLADGNIVQSLARRTVTNWTRASLIAALLDIAPLRRRALRRWTIDPAGLAHDPEAARRLVLKRAQPAHHVSGTCRMGIPNSAEIVVDPACRVVGVEGLRVVDAAIMPTLVSANPHIPVLMMAEKMAAMLPLAD